MFEYITPLKDNIFCRDQQLEMTLVGQNYAVFRIFYGTKYFYGNDTV